MVDLQHLAARHHRDAVGQGQRLFLVVGDEDEGDADRALESAAARSASPRAASCRARPAARPAAAPSAGRPARGRAPRAGAGRPTAGAARALAIARQLDQRQRLLDLARHLGLAEVRACAGRRRCSRARSGAGRSRSSGTPCWSAARSAARSHIGWPSISISPGGRQLEAGEHAQQRGLAAARGSEQREELAAPDVEGDIVDRLHRPEMLGDVAGAR